MKITGKLVILLSLLLLLCHCAEDKISPVGKGSVEGRVLDEEDLSPIANAEVTTHPPTHSVLTDSVGSFFMNDLESGEYKIIASKKDYFSTSSGTKITHNGMVHVTISLAKKSAKESLPWFSGVCVPGNKEANVQVNTIFSWELAVPADSIKYAFRLYESGRPDPVQVASPRDTFLHVNGLKFSTTYLWQVSAENGAGRITTDMHSFTTRSFPEEFVLYAKMVDGVSQIFVTDTLFVNSIQLTHNNYHSWRPRVNIQKTKIAFLSTRDINPQLYTMNMDGTNVVKVTNITTGGYYNKGVGFSWLPDGEHLVFSSYNQLYTVYYDGSGRRLVTTLNSDKHFREVDWSPAGDKIVALALGIGYYDAEILLMNSDGSGVEVLVDSMPGALADPVFSINGNNILYTYDASEYQINKRRQLDARIFRYDLKTGETSDLSSGKDAGTNDLTPMYTQNGGHITFINTSNSIGVRKDLWMLQSGDSNNMSRQLLVKDVEAGDWAK